MLSKIRENILLDQELMPKYLYLYKYQLKPYYIVKIAFNFLFIISALICLFKNPLIIYFLVMIIIFQFIECFSFYNLKRYVKKLWFNDLLNSLNNLLIEPSNDAKGNLIKRNIITKDGQILADGVAYDESCLKFEFRVNIACGNLLMLIAIFEKNSNYGVALYLLDNDWFNFLISHNLLENDSLFNLLKRDKKSFILKVISF